MHGPLAPGLLAAYPSQAINFQRSSRAASDPNARLNEPVNNSYPSIPGKVESATPCKPSQPAQPVAPVVPRLPAQPAIRPGG
jgi:hypothetical protein